MAKKATRGGSRPGAGRKRFGEHKRVRLTIALDLDVLLNVQQYASDNAISRSEALNQLLRKSLE